MNIRQVLKLIREQRGVSQAELSELTGLDRSFISLIECGKRNPSLATLEKIAIAYGIETWEIIKQVQDSSKE